jgi:hypothetical protein
MKLWKISQTAHEDWDTYDSAVVAAASEDAARGIHPGMGGDWDNNARCWASESSGYGTWCRTPILVKVELIGEAVEDTPTGVIVASFHAG